MIGFKSDGYSVPALLAISLHVFILVVGVVAVDFSDESTKELETPVIVNATIIDISKTVIGQREAKERAAQKAAAVAAAKKKKQEAELKRKKEAQKKALQDQKKKLAQAKRLEEKKKAAEEAKRQENLRKVKEQKRLAEESEKKRLAQEAKQRRLAEEAAKKEKAFREQELIRQAEAERLAEQEQRRQEEARRIAEEAKKAEELLAAKAAAEQAARLAKEEAQMVQSISDLINKRITSSWTRPASARNNMKTQLRIYFLPNGEIRDAQITKGSGDALFDQRAIDAVYKVRRIEELADVDSYVFERNFRQIDLIFNPQDLRN